MNFKYHLFFLFVFMVSCHNHQVDYACIPCDLPCDELIFDKAGICPHCKMDLIPKSELLVDTKLILNEIDLHDGQGRFLIDGGFQKEKEITIHYYKPQGLKDDSPVLLVLPGAGRNGGDYRDDWIENATKYNVLILSLEYSEEFYPEFWSYNLAGMITDVKINEERTAMTGFNFNEDPDDWIFADFDRIFNLVKDKLNMSTETYDLFGHSAGGQLLHRFAIFGSSKKANKILASNSGWYTVPDDSSTFPTGLKNSHLSEKDVDFSKKLLLFLGETDDASETRGELRHSAALDLQGLHRLERGMFFYNESREVSTGLGANYNWELQVVPNVGHDHEAMSHAAADYLYSNQ